MAPQDKEALVDVVSVNYRSAECLRACLASLVCQERASVPYLIHVADNDACPLPWWREAQAAGFLRHYPMGANAGFAAAVNRVVAASRAPYLLLVNPDCRFITPVLDALVGFLEREKDVAAVGPLILNGDGSVQGSARSFPDASTLFFGRRSLLTRLFPRNRLSRKNIVVDRPPTKGGFVPVDWVSGACVLVRRDAILDVGAMDERFFLYWEDADWCKRMWRAGYQVAYWPHVPVVHLGGESTAKRPFASLLAFHRSAFRFYVKYRNPSLEWLDGIVLWVLGLRLSIVGALHLAGILVGKRT